MNCRECGAPLRQLIAVVVDCPFPQVNLNKTAIRDPDVHILGAFSTNPTVYCTGCGYITHSPLIGAIQRDDHQHESKDEYRDSS